MPVRVALPPPNSRAIARTVAPTEGSVINWRGVAASMRPLVSPMNRVATVATCCALPDDSSNTTRRFSGAAGAVSRSSMPFCPPFCSGRRSAG